VSLGLAPGLSGADTPRATPEPRQVEGATHVVLGLVTGVYSAERPSGLDGADAGTIYVLEINVEKVANGEGPKIDQVVYVRCAKSKQTTIPRLRARGWAYMTRDRDGGYSLIVPDGFDVFAATKS
jgi:hypothetical protein